MVIFLYGPDSYRRREKLKEYLKRYRAKYKALSLSHFYLGQDNEWDKLKDFSQAQSLFEVSKLGIISEISGLEDKNQKELIKILKENLESKDLTLIIESDKKPAKEFNFLLIFFSSSNDSLSNSVTNPHASPPYATINKFWLSLSKTKFLFLISACKNFCDSMPVKFSNL